mgnify:CR=1 FL=1
MNCPARSKVGVLNSRSPNVAETRLIYGFHAVLSKLRQDPEAVLEVFVAEQRQDPRVRDLLRQTELLGVRVIPANSVRLDGMAGHGRHQGVLARVDGRQRVLTIDHVLEGLAEPPLFLVLDGIQDPHNLGACLRVADGAGAHAVIAPKDKAVGLSAVAAKVACGAADTVPYVTVTNLARTLRDLHERDIWTIGAAAEADADLYHIDQKGGVAWVLGAEGSGLRRLTRETCDQLARIPMFGLVESLNVSVASGICLYEARRQRTNASAGC